MTERLTREKNFVSIVCYCNGSNEESDLKDFVSRVLELMEKNFNAYEIICVYDNQVTGEGFEARIEGLLNQEKYSGMLTLVNMSYPHGLEKASQAGLDVAIGDFVFEFDSLTFDYPDTLVMEAYKTALRGYDIVSVGPSSNSSLAASVYYKILTKLADLPLTQLVKTDRFRVVSRRALNRVKSMFDMVPYRKMAYSFIGLPSMVLTFSSKRAGGKYFSDTEKRERLAIATDSFILFTNCAYKFGMAMSLFMALLSFLTAIYSLAFFIMEKPVEGWTSTILFTSFILGGVSVLFTFVIKYLSLITAMMLKKNNYVLSSIKKMGAGGKPQDV